MVRNIQERVALLYVIKKQRTTSRRTGIKGMKAHPTIHMPTTFVNWGLPKSEGPIGLCVMRLTSAKNLKATPREMTLKI